MDYQIKSGDTLSGIVMQKYGVKGNDVQKYYTEIARLNGIDDPNLIFAGNNINLPDNLFETNNTQNDNTGLEVESSEKYSAEAFNNWLDTNNSKLDALLEPQNDFTKDISSMTPEELDREYNLIQGQLDEMQQIQDEVNASEFTMFEHPDLLREDGTTNVNLYLEGGAKFAQSLYDNWEQDGEEGIDYDEYVESEKARLKDGEEMTPEAEEIAKTAFTMMDLNNDGVIDKDEIQCTFSTIDMADNNPDGKINFGTYGDAILASDTIKENATDFYNKYFK